MATSTFCKSVWNFLYAIDYIIADCDFDPKDEGTMRAHANGMYIRSGRLVPGCVGALDRMAKKERKMVTTPVKDANRETCTRGCAIGPAMWGDNAPLPFVGQILLFQYP